MDIHDFNAAMVAAFSTTVAARSTGEPGYVATVPGITAPVEVHFALPEEWVDTYTLPAINVSRPTPMLDRSRAQPAFRARELNTDSGNPHTFLVQSDLPQPINLMYMIDFVCERQSEADALYMFSLLQLPPFGYNASLTVNTVDFPYRQTSSRDLSDMRSKTGRKFDLQLTYVVEAWLAPSLATSIEKQILTVLGALELQPDTVDLDSRPPPPVPISLIDTLPADAP